MTKFLKITLLSCSALFSGAVLAVPFSFNSGTPARSSEVNANFSDVESQIQTNATAIANLHNTYNYTNFSANVNNTKTFNYESSSPGDNCTTATRATTINGNNRVVREVRYGSQTTPTGRCRVRDFGYSIKPEGIFHEYMAYIDIDNQTTETRRITLNKPVIRRGTSMVIGKTIADTTSTTQTGDQPGTGFYMDTITLLGFEDVLVPFQSYTGCMKIRRQRTSSLSYGQQIADFITWHCDGVGLVKLVSIENGIHRALELINFTTP